jgi:hypothetical protein
MTNTDLTLIAALLDRSGSMKSCKEATKSGFDEMMAKHRSEPGEAVVTLAMFDDEYENVYTDVPVAEVSALNLIPRNMTAMLDAVGRFVTEVGEHLASHEEAERPGAVICLIMTDGLENASQKWSWDCVKALITQQREQYNWSFMFLGANIDAVKVGGRIGVPKASSLTYNANDDDAVHSSYATAAREMVRHRSASREGEGYSVSFSAADRREAIGDSKKSQPKKKKAKKK